jgi:LacI family transcriptional regulator, galactose operon repressor
MGARRVTMRQIAAVAGVSRTTVSFVLNDVAGIKIGHDTRRRILEVARELNYVPNSAAISLARGSTGTIALVLRQTQHQVISDRFLMPVLMGISAAVKAQGFHVLIEALDPTDTSANYGNLVRSRRADGIVLSGPRLDDKEIDRLVKDKIPLVMMGQLPDNHIPFIDVDNKRGAIIAVQHLIGLGHRRIACITNAPLIYTSSLDRLAGYKEALEQADIAYDESLIRFGDYTDESGASAMRELLGADQPPTAVFVASDVVALGALSQIAATHLRVPEDIALVGFDDIPLAQYVDPPLTSVRLPAYSLGWGAGEMLLNLISGRETSDGDHVLLDTELVIRQSCGWNLP